MAMLKHIHRDMLNRVIRLDDIVIWSPQEYNSRFKFGTVTGTTPKRVYVKLKTDIREEVRPYPIRISSKNLLVITQQVLANIEGNVGASQYLEETRSS
ncbi:UNVERIFIED_CONTAM: hypothetical protein RF648_21170 [Kocuria sp. CPCC 205274]|uniref:Uncharacterized protein n=1 Tax=Herbiconiux daphne TaxID=2970914 RepID=A0ABT2H9Q2_9MICO|nr:hypothetical protein [Herbiconiux daphne]MCS5736690.1 hypothetical protein [Herbiconiux daphne]